MILEARVRATTSEQREAFRARIVLSGGRRRLDALDRGEGRHDAAHGEPVARPLCARGLAGLADKPRRGRRRNTMSRAATASWRRSIDRRRRGSPAGPDVDRRRTRGRARAAGLARPTDAQDRSFGGRKSWCESDDPDFVAKAAEVVGLYMAPPENAIVICVEEKPSIQALERAQAT